ncbi:MAG: iron transporter [Tissierellia bacterium]|nr:iron transporter [Tissierellia bacterium]
MFKKSKILLILALVLVFSLALVGCGQDKPAEEKADTATEEKAEETKPEEKEEPADDANAPGGGFEEFDIGDEQEVGPLIVAGVYFQPVDMEPAGNSIPKEEADCHIEADIAASEEGTALGYGIGDFVPWLQVKALVQKEGSDKVDEVAFMPMNASDGPHYGANYKFPEGLGKYSIKFEISAPGNDYLLHVDEETGVTGRFWTEPIVVEWPDFEWAGPQW